MHTQVNKLHDVCTAAKLLHSRRSAHNDSNDDAVAAEVVAELHRPGCATSTSGSTQLATSAGVCIGTGAEISTTGRRSLPLVTPAQTAVTACYWCVCAILQRTCWPALISKLSWLRNKRISGKSSDVCQRLKPATLYMLCLWSSSALNSSCQAVGKNRGKG